MSAHGPWQLLINGHEKCEPFEFAVGTLSFNPTALAQHRGPWTEYFLADRRRQR
jgi:hypothetical protein